jgi:hypothetical protein
MKIKYKPGIILFYCVFIIAVTSITSCKKVEPANVAIVTPPPPPPPPPPPISSSCAEYWVCAEASYFLSVYYTGGFNTPGAHGASVSTAEKIFFAGGHGDVIMDGDISTVLIYNNVLNTWQGSDLTIPRSYLSGAAAGNKVLFAGGKTDQCLYCGSVKYFDAVDIFDVNTYSKNIGRLSEPRADLASVNFGNKAYFIGGKTLQGYSRKMDVYDANSDTWSVLEIPNSRANAGAAVIGNKIYISGGINAGGPLKIIDIYDAVTGAWSVLQAPNEHPNATVVTLNNKIFIAGGDGNGNRSLDIFNAIDNTWKVMQLSDSRYDMATAVANNKIIFLGGNYSKNVDTYNDNTGLLLHSTLSEGVAGVNAGSVGDRCFFTPFLYEKGWSMAGTVIIIQP